MRAARRSTPLAVMLALSALAPASRAQDWPCWRGADGDGVAKDDAWNSAGRTLWSRDVGLGFSSASVVGERVYTLGFDADSKQNSLWCLAADTGAVLWKSSYAGVRRGADRHDGGTLSTPAVSGACVYASSSEGWLRAFERDTGTLLWARPVAQEVGTAPDEYGFSASPLVRGEQVIVCMDRVVGLDSHTGKILWRSEPVGVDHSTPTLFTLQGEPRLAAFGKEQLCVLEPASGEQRFSLSWHEGHVGKSIATPIALGERVFISSGENRGCALVAFDGGAAHALWASQVMRTAMAGCVLVDDHLYGFDEALLKCLDLEGHELWRQRGLGSGALSAAGTRLVLLTSRGELVVAEASPTAYHELSRAKLFNDGDFWAPPVFAGGRIYARSSLGELVCRDHRQAPTPAAPLALVADATAALPDARSLFATHLERVGGAERVRALRSLRMKGTFELRAMGVRSVAVEVQRLAPDLLREEIQFPHGLPDKVVRVFDGELAWELNRVLGDRLLDADACREARESDALHAAADWEQSYRSMRTVARVEFAERPAYRVDTVLASGTPRTLFFDVASGFLLGREGASEAVVVWDDWRTFDGLALPMLEKRFLEDTGVEEVLRFQEVEFDRVTPDAFARPPKVLQLLEQR